MAALEPGSLLAHYRILEKLGGGGQGTTYKAEDTRLSRPVVIKTLRPDLAGSEGARRRFEREACLCSALDNPNICAVYDVGEADGLAYIVMQYVEGRTLRQIMTGRPLDVLSALSIAVQIADALAVAHSRGIIHRDIKPSNIVVQPEGQAKVLDFGLAKMLEPDDGKDPLERAEESTAIGVPYGSMGYGSPEQAQGARVDHRSDVFSLGVVLYEMLTGQRAFRGRYPIEVLHAVIHDTPRPAREINPRIPPTLQAIVDRALAKDAPDRYQTMAALRDDLKAVLRRLSSEAETGAVSAEAMARLRRRRRARATWFLTGGLTRMLGRLRPLPRSRRPATAPTAVPASPSAPAASRPASWGTETKPTIAVVPFRNLSGDSEADFYEFSLADGVITELAMVRSLVVRPSSYVARYAGQNVDPRQVGEELAVGHVLTGTFLKTPERMRVSAQLLATETGEILWSEKMDIAARDLIGIQDTIAARVADGLRLKLTPEEQAKIERLPTRDADAWEFYLRGRDLLFRYILSSFDDADLEEAIRMFNEAVGKDPLFAMAHAALGRCYVHHAQGYGGAEYFLLADRAVRRALELDPGLVEARLQMVHVDLHQGNKDGAHETVAALLKEAPTDPAVLYVAGMLYRLDGLYDQAIAVFDRLLELNPQDVVIVGYNKARVYTHQRRYDKAIEELERARAAEPDHPLVKTFLAMCYFNQGRVDEAQALMEDVLAHHPHLDGVQPVLAWCFSAKGEHERARALITDRVKETAAADHDISFWLASFYAMEGMADEAVEWVRRAVRLGNENYPLFAVSSKLDRLRTDPRFQEILAELKRLWEERRARDQVGIA
jgi:serine/threonine protein kinase/TolB-like protein/Tfp pilus assembly protein PilF